MLRQSQARARSGLGPRRQRRWALEIDQYTGLSYNSNMCMKIEKRLSVRFHTGLSKLSTLEPALMA